MISIFNWELEDSIPSEDASNDIKEFHIHQSKLQTDKGNVRGEDTKRFNLNSDIKQGCSNLIYTTKKKIHNLFSSLNINIKESETETRKQSQVSNLRHRGTSFMNKSFIKGAIKMDSSDILKLIGWKSEVQTNLKDQKHAIEVIWNSNSISE